MSALTYKRCWWRPPKPVDSWREAIRGAVRRPQLIESAFRRDVGVAIEFRIALDLGERPGHEAALAILPPACCEQLLRTAGYTATASTFSRELATDPLCRVWMRETRPELPVDDAQIEALLACYDMAVGYRVFVRHAEKMDVGDLRSLFLHVFGSRLDGYHRVVRDGLCGLWEAFVTEGRRQLLAMGDRVLVAPVVSDGYGVADLLIGNTLVEIKVYAEPENELERWLDQLLAYALLDSNDSLAIERLAIYVGWEAITLEVELNELITMAADGRNARLDSLRGDLRTAMADDLRSARVRRQVSHHHGNSGWWS